MTDETLAPAKRREPDGYGVTARILVWVEGRYQVALVDALDSAIRGGSNDAGLWILLTGISVDDLWSEYVAEPALEFDESR